MKTKTTGKGYCGIPDDETCGKYHAHAQDRAKNNQDWIDFVLILQNRHPAYDFKSDRINNAYSFLDSVAADPLRAKAFLSAEPSSEIHPDRQRSAIVHVQDRITRAEGH